MRGCAQRRTTQESIGRRFEQRRRRRHRPPSRMTSATSSYPDRSFSGDLRVAFLEAVTAANRHQRRELSEWPTPSLRSSVTTSKGFPNT